MKAVMWDAEGGRAIKFFQQQLQPFFDLQFYSI